jgi:hypothetical protein
MTVGLGATKERKEHERIWDWNYGRRRPSQTDGLGVEETTALLGEAQEALILLKCLICRGID